MPWCNVYFDLRRRVLSVRYRVDALTVCAARFASCAALGSGKVAVRTPVGDQPGVEMVRRGVSIKMRAPSSGAFRRGLRAPPPGGFPSLGLTLLLRSDSIA